MRPEPASHDRLILTIVLVDDRENSFQVISNALSTGVLQEYKCTLRRETAFEQAAEALQSGDIDMCLLAHHLFNSDHLSNLPESISTPIIVICDDVDSSISPLERIDGVISLDELNTKTLAYSIHSALRQKRYKKEVSQLHDKYQHLVNMALNAIICIDESGLITEWNPMAESMLGWTRGYAIGKNMAELIIPQAFRSAHYRGIANYLKTRNARILGKQHELVLLTRSGSEIPVRMTVIAQHNDNRTEFVSFTEDLSEQKSIATNTLRYQQLVATASDMMAFVDNNYVYRAVNDAYVRVFHRSDQAEGRNLEELPAKIKNVLLSHLAQCFEGREVSCEATLSTPNQTDQFISLHFTPYIENRDITGAVIVAQDITTIKISQKKLARAYGQLESITDILSDYISGTAPAELFDRMLKLALGKSGSKFGFIGEIDTDEAGMRSLKTRALTNISWDKASQEMYEKASKGILGFSNMETLFGAVITSGEPVISQDPAHDKRSGGLPENHPELTAFLGIPFKYKDETVGMIGLANRPSGYNESSIALLRPISSTCEAIINGLRQYDKRREAEAKYRYLYDENPAIFMTVTADERIVSINDFGCRKLEYNANQLNNTLLSGLIHSDDLDLMHEKLAESFANQEQLTSWEMRFKTCSGELIYMSNTARVIRANNMTAALVVCEDISKTHELSKKLSHQASHDALTGLVNRREFEHRLTDAINRSQEEENALYALCYIDLDEFKIINDTAGHVAGDQLLRLLSQSMNKIIRQNDTLARLGGDEFAVLMQNRSVQEAKKVAQSLLKEIMSFRFNWHNSQFRVGASIGVVMINKDTKDMTDVLKLADSACYAAKDAGKNTIHVHTGKDLVLEQRRAEMLWVERIHYARQHDQFELYYQTILPVDARANDCHYEILVRLIDAGGNICSPGEFLPSAERYHIADKIDKWVIEHAFEWFNKYFDELDDSSIFCVNLSGQSVGNNYINDFIIQQKKLHNIAENRFCFEITETAAISNMQNASEFISNLKEEGFLIALDDFGSGLSSFGYLKTLPVDYVKIDGLFIQNMINDEIDAAMVQSIHQIAQIMDKKTIAEFVESKQTLAKLKQIGVNYAQGYGIDKPEPLHTLISSLKIADKKIS